MNLLMITKFYPYGTGEAFIENEIEVLAKYYNKITIIACEVRKEDNEKRQMPKNVKAYKVTTGSKSKDIVKGISYLTSNDKDIINEKNMCDSVASKVFLGYFEAKSQRIYKFIENNNFIDDIVKEPYVLYSYWFFITSRVGTLIANSYKPIYMFTRAHRYDLYEEENKIKYLPYRKLFLESFDSIFPCSDDGVNYLKNRYDKFSDKISTSLLGTQDYGIAENSIDDVFRIVSCSRVEAVKRLDKLIDALYIIDNDKIKVEWTHIGSGKEFNTIKNYARKKLSHIKFDFKGNMKNEDIMKLYKKSSFDLFINVSSSEGLPVSIMEAISFGIPAIATNVGGTSEVVINDITGKLIENKFTSKELAEAINIYIQNKDLKNIRESSRAFWEERFKASSNYNKMYKSIEINYSKKLLD